MGRWTQRGRAGGRREERRLSEVPPPHLCCVSLERMKAEDSHTVGSGNLGGRGRGDLGSLCPVQYGQTQSSPYTGMRPEFCPPQGDSGVASLSQVGYSGYLGDRVSQFTQPAWIVIFLLLCSLQY
jgi:hypothetical protein